MSQWLSIINNWFRSQPKEEENSVEQFTQLWNDQEAGHHVAFIAIALNTDGPFSSTIKDMGLSVWRKHSLVRTLSYHWRIEEKIETKDIVEFGSPDSFDFGSTQPIPAGDVKTVFDDWIMSIASECERICLIVYGKQQTNALWKNWKPPIPVVVLDIEILWRLARDETIYSSFEEMALTIKPVANSTSALDHAGNQAHCLNRMVRILGDGREAFPQDWENLNSDAIDSTQRSTNYLQRNNLQVD